MNSTRANVVVTDSAGLSIQVSFGVPSGLAMWVVGSRSWVEDAEELWDEHGAGRGRKGCLLGSRRSSTRRRVDRLRYQLIGGMYTEPIFEHFSNEMELDDCIFVP